IQLGLHPTKLPLQLFDNLFISHVRNHAGDALICHIIFLRALTAPRTSLPPARGKAINASRPGRNA
ncbi:MAG: hypothetical protein LBC18_15735, partial [Opitutaceae bacterium]|nr:hypothetical protein [Opitutaceae bacterium]